MSNRTGDLRYAVSRSPFHEQTGLVLLIKAGHIIMDHLIIAATPLQVFVCLLVLIQDESQSCLLYTSPSPRDRG